MKFMAKQKKDESEQIKKKQSRSGANLNLWIDPEIRADLDAFVESHEPPTTLTGVVELAIKRYLESVRRMPLNGTEANRR